MDLEVLGHKFKVMKTVMNGNRIKSLLRTDADYLIMTETRDADTMKIIVAATTRVTKNLNFTFHITHPKGWLQDLRF